MNYVNTNDQYLIERKKKKNQRPISIARGVLFGNPSETEVAVYPGGLQVLSARAGKRMWIK